MKQNKADAHAVLDEAIDVLMPHLSEQMPLNEKLRSFAAACIAVSDLADWNVAEEALSALADAIGLTDELGAAGPALKGKMPAEAGNWSYARDRNRMAEMSAGSAR